MHKAAVDEEELRVARRAPLAWRRDKTLHPSNLGQLSGPVGLIVNGEQPVEELCAKDLISALAQVLRRRHAQSLAAVISQSERNLGMCQRIVRREISQMITFGGF